MGWSCSWIAVRGKESDKLLDELRMQRSSEREAFPESRWTAANLPGGWFLVFRSDQCEPPTFEGSTLSGVSANCELIHSSVEEHVMFCSTAYWRHGQKVFEIVHDAQKGIYDLQSSGDLPATFANVRTKFFSEQAVEGGEKANVDLIFEIPLQIGVEFTGFRHDHDYPTDEETPFRVLVADATQASASCVKKPWWRLW
jgi:hypothetical protein